MASSLRASSLAVAALSFCLNIAIIGTAGRALNVFNTQHTSDPYFLPLWPQHFDTRELAALIGTSAAIVVLNALLMVTLLAVSAQQQHRAKFLLLGWSALGFIVSLIAIIFPALLNGRAPTRDTLQTWTCMWRGVGDQGVPSQFDALCHESRFAFYTTIPSFVFQVFLLGVAVYSFLCPAPPRGMRLEEEKGQELGRVRTDSFPVGHETLSILGKR